MKTIHKVSLIIGGGFALGIVAFLVWAYSPAPVFEPVAYEPRAPGYWPTEGWQYSTPEEQGMSSEALVEMMSFYRRSLAEDPELYIDSMTIVRNGYVVAEFYNNPLYPRDELHIIHSATKSIVGALVSCWIRATRLSMSN